MKNENYINIQGWMINELGLKGNVLIIYALIFGFSQDYKSSFRGSYEYIATAVNLNRRSVIEIIEHLVDSGLVKKIHHTKGNSYKVVKKMHQPSEKNAPVSSEKNAPSINSINNKLEYQPASPKYKSKAKIFKQKGLDYKPKKMTDKQDFSVEALKDIDYFKQKAKDYHDLDYLKYKDDKRNKKIRNLVIEAKKKLEPKFRVKDLIEYYLTATETKNGEEVGRFEWCNYTPEVCFKNSTVEEFENKHKATPLITVGQRKFYTKDEVKQAEKNGEIKYDFNLDKYVKNV